MNNRNILVIVVVAALLAGLLYFNTRTTEGYGKAAGSLYGKKKSKPVIS